MTFFNPSSHIRSAFIRGFVVLGTVSMLILAACSTPVTKTLPTTKRQSVQTFTLAGQQPQTLTKARADGKVKDLGALDPNRILPPLSISIPLQNQGVLRALLANLYDPASPFYHKFLTSSQFVSQFAPGSKTVSEVSDYLTASGLTVTSVSPSQQFINFKGTVGSIQNAFHVQLHSFSLNGNTYYGPVSDPSVATTLAGMIQNVSGLDNFSVYKTHSHVQATGNGYTPQDLQKAYNIAPLASQNLDGSGQSIAFLELDDYQDSDIAAYQQEYNLPQNTNITRMPVDGGATIGQGAAEVTLDLEIALAAAPKANLLVYEGPNTGQGINDVYAQIVNDNKAKTVSVSWGLCESQVGSAELQTMDQIFQQGAAEGMSFFAASGDSGAYDCGTSSLAVDSPADDPWVTGVGGTSLTLNGSGSYGSETAWSCTSANCQSQAPQGAGGGGGISSIFPVPAFQQGLTPARAGSGNSGRYVPDVGADADPQTGYAIYCTAQSANCQGDMVVGGTSAAAPLWAGIDALLNQSLTGQKTGSFGNMNAALYSVAKSQPNAFHDVKSGDNLHYQATAGYDLATGWGSPDANQLVQGLLAYAANGGGTTTPPNPTATPNPGSTATPTTGTPTATVISGTPTVGSTTPTIPPTTGSGQELLANNGFENGQSPWQQTSSGGYQLIDTSNPNAGSYNGDLCGYLNCDDILYQSFQVPTSGTSLTLSYYWYMVTQETTSSCVDTFTATIAAVNADGSLGQSLQQIKKSCNANANNQYDQVTVDISSLLQSNPGDVVAVVFETQANGNQATRVFVDDVSVQAQ